MSSKRISSAAVAALLATFLAGCGAEVAGTAATVGNLQVQQLEQAKAQQRQIESQLGAAMSAAQERASAAAGQ
jgi:hypothetical protein